MSNVLIGITGCIAAYKAASLIREFRKNNFGVKAILTKNGSEFITPLTLRTLSGEKVYTSLFDDENEYSTEHIALSEWADMLVIAPASANIIGKMANGIADDLLSTEYLAFSKPVLVVPSMNFRMYSHPAVQRNIAVLRERGVEVMEPDEGFLACGENGKGRFPDIGRIFMHARRIAEKSSALKGKRVLITGGGTVAKIDPVRVIGNLSSGAMADAFVTQSFLRKASKVTYVHGRIEVKENILSKNIRVETSSEMLDALKTEIKDADLFIMAAAVNDFRSSYSERKIKREGSLSIKLYPDIDVLKELAKTKSGALRIGFALESENAEKNGLKKLREKKLDYIVINSPENIGAAKGTVTLLSSGGKRLRLKNLSKDSIAERVLEWIEF